MEAGALWGRCPGQVLSAADPAPSARAVPAPREALPDPPGQGTDLQELQDCAAGGGRAALCCPALLRVAPVLSPGSAPRLFNCTQ